MLDLQFIRQNADAVLRNCADRGVTADVPRVLELDSQRRRLIQEVESSRHRQKEVQDAVRKADAAARQALVDEGRTLKDRLRAADEQLRDVEEQLRRACAQIPNMTHPDAPVGRTAADNRELRRWGELPQFAFEPKDHVDLAEALDLIDFQAGARVAGTGFYFLKNEAVLLELALVHYALMLLTEHGFTPVSTPDLARDEVLEGIGFLPRGPETQVYSIEGQNLSLIATAEITLGGMLRDSVLEESQLPIKLAGLSHCFRTEAGAHGRATRGIYRVHQFTKLEMFAFTTPEHSDAMLEELVGIEERIFQGLGIPYRVIDTCTGDLGGPAYRKYDLEAWMPGRLKAEGAEQKPDGQQGAAKDPAALPPSPGTQHSALSTQHSLRGTWGEVTSTSNCTDYQARRLAVRFRRKGQTGTHFVHTLNGTAVAVSRALIAILENYQQADGSVVIPPALLPWVGKQRVEPRT